MDTRVLVIGSEGFIGKHVVYGLSKYFDVVRGDMRFCDDPDYRRVDVTRHEEIQDILEHFMPDVVLNLAGEYGILNGEEHPARCFDINTIGVLRLCMECTTLGIKLVHLSTGDVYGDMFNKTYVSGSDIPVTAPKNLYSLSKLAGEAILNRFREDYGLDGIIVRPFMIYGGGEPPTKYRSAMVRMCDAAVHGKEMTVHKGSERAWLHVRDFVEALALIIKDGYGDYNVGSEDYRPIMFVAERACELAGKGSIAVVEPPPLFRSMVKRVDYSRIKELGWEPQVTIEEGIDKEIGWCRMLMGAPRTTEEAEEYAGAVREMVVF